MGFGLDCPRGEVLITEQKEGPEQTLPDAVGLNRRFWPAESAHAEFARPKTKTIVIHPQTWKCIDRPACLVDRTTN